MKVSVSAGATLIFHKVCQAVCSRAKSAVYSIIDFFDLMILPSHYYNVWQMIFSCVILLKNKE